MRRHNIATATVGAKAASAFCVTEAMFKPAINAYLDLPATAEPRTTIKLTMQHRSHSTARSKVAVSVSLFGYKKNTKQYFIYGRADRRGKPAITFERSDFREIHESKTFEMSY